MELLILKSGQQYIRVREDHYEIVGLDKASVFPMDKMGKVNTHLKQLTDAGFEKVCIKKLVLTEEDI